jgi:hypothetical protein
MGASAYGTVGQPLHTLRVPPVQCAPAHHPTIPARLARDAFKAQNSRNIRDEISGLEKKAKKAERNGLLSEQDRGFQST